MYLGTLCTSPEHQCAQVLCYPKFEAPIFQCGYDPRQVVIMYYGIMCETNRHIVANLACITNCGMLVRADHQDPAVIEPTHFVIDCKVRFGSII